MMVWISANYWPIRASDTTLRDSTEGKDNVEKEMGKWGWRDCSAGKRTQCSCRGPGFSSQILHQEVHNCL